MTLGTAIIPQWRYNLAMLLAFLGVIRYGAALFAVKEYMHILSDDKTAGFVLVVFSTILPCKNGYAHCFNKGIRRIDHMVYASFSIV